MEKFFYEFKPFLCFALATYALNQPEMHSLGKFSSIFLVACGAILLYSRLKYRGFIN